MMNDQLDQLIDRAVSVARADANTLTDDQVTTSAARVRARLELPAAATAAPAVLGCAEIRSLLPARAAGALAGDRAILVADHLRDCLACRREEIALRRGTQAAVAPRRSRWLSLAAAAALVGAIGGGAWFARHLLVPPGTIEVVAGAVLDPHSGQVLPAGASFATGELVRTAAGGGAILELADGSRVELRERAAVRVDRRTDGAVVRLERGQLLVEAAKQSSGQRLRVATDDALVTVVGTVFSVNAGIKGSRVGVLEGAVRVGSGGQDALLGPGEQLATNPSLAPVPLAKEVEWSQHAERYLALLRELPAIEAELAALGREDLRFAPSLDAAVPASRLYLALPNATGRLAEGWNITRDRLAANPAFEGWWSEAEGEGWPTELDEALAILAEVGASLGEEIVVVGTDLPVDDQPGSGIAVIAPVIDPAHLRATLLAELPRFAEHGSEIRVVEGELPPGSGMTLWLGDGLVGLGDHRTLLAVAAARAGGSRWQGTALREAAIERYQRGIDTLVVVDTSSEAATPLAPSMLVLDDRVLDQTHETRLTLSFPDGRQGPASWIAAPAALGVLDLLSAETTAAVAFAIDDPAAALTEMLTLGEEHQSGLAERLAEVRDRLGIDPVADLAATLGGEIAIALDGPMLPVPAWKLVAEVVDPGRLDHALTTLVGELDRLLAEEGRGHASVAESTVDGISIHVVSIEDREGGATTFAWGQVGGYLVAAPSGEAIARSARNADSGYTLAGSAALRDGLPHGAENGLSGLLWVDLSGASGAFDLLAGALPEAARGEAAALLGGGRPLVGAMWATDGSIELAGAREHSPLGWLRLALLAGALG